MEDFNKRLADLKTSVINEIKEILPAGKEHTYKERFYCTIIDGELSPVSLAMRIKNDNGKIVLHDLYEANAEEYDTELSSYEIETIIYAYEVLHKELRAEKIERIKELVAKGGGKVKLDVPFGVSHSIDGKVIESNVEVIEVGNNDSNGKTVDCLWFDCSHGDETHEETDTDFTDDELDVLVVYVKRIAQKIDISLTYEQREAVEKLKNAFAELQKAKVSMIVERDYNIMQFYNESQLLEISNTETE